MNFLCRLRECFDWLCPLRFAKYRPAPRLRTRQLERRLLRRLAWSTADSAR
jgi:hypothetical protein